MIKKLINFDIDVNFCVNYKMLLIMVCERGYVFVVVELIGVGVDFN